MKCPICGGRVEPIPDMPEWLPVVEWNAFMEMRKKIKKPVTDYAKKLLIGDLLKFKNMGQDPAEVLNQSIKNSWQGLFELKNAPIKQQVTESKPYVKAQPLPTPEPEKYISKEQAAEFMKKIRQDLAKSPVKSIKW